MDVLLRGEMALYNENGIMDELDDPEAYYDERSAAQLIKAVGVSWANMKRPTPSCVLATLWPMIDSRRPKSQGTQPAHLCGYIPVMVRLDERRRITFYKVGIELGVPQ